MDRGDGATAQVWSRARRVLRLALRWSAASAYQLTVRAAVSLTTALLFVYFTVNSPSVVARLGDLLADALPGKVAIAGLRWGPSPGTLTVSGLTLRDPDGVLVLQAARLDVEVAWLALVQDLLDGDDALQVRVVEVALQGLELRLEETAGGELRLMRALVRPPPPDEPPSTLRLGLEFDAIHLRDSTFAMDLAGSKVDIEGLGADVELTVDVTPTATAVDWTLRGVKARHAGIEIDGFAAAGLAQLPSGALAVESASGDLAQARLRAVRISGDATRLERGDIDVRWAPALSVAVRRAALTTRSPEEPFLRPFLGDLFAAEARYVGDVEVDEAGRTVARGEVEGKGRMVGFDVGSVTARIDLQTPTAAGDPVDVDVADLAIMAFGGELRSERLHYQLGKDGWQRVTAKLGLRQVSSAEALTAPGVGMTLAAALPIAATLDGDCAVDVRMRGGGDAPLELYVRTDLDLTIGRDSRASWLPASLPTLYLRGGVDTTMAPSADPAQPLTIGLRGLILSDRRDDRGPSLTSSATFAQLDGALDLAAKTMDLRGGLQLPALGAMLRGFGVAGVDGALAVQDLKVQGPLLAPTVQAEIRGRGLRAAGVAIESVRAELALASGALALRSVSAQLAQGAITGGLTLDLYRRDLTELRKPMVLHGRKVALHDVELSKLLGDLGVPGVAGRARIDGLDFTMALDRPVETFRGDGHVHVEGLAAADERFERLDADVRIGGGAVDVSGLELIVPPLFRLGQPALGERGLISGSLRYRMAAGAWSADLQVPALRFDQFGAVRKLGMPLRGSLQGRVVASGDGRDLQIDGALTRVALRELAWDAIVMGDAELQIGKAAGQPAMLASDAFFPRFKLLAGSAVHFRKLVPEVVSLQLNADRFDPYVLLALPPMDGLKLFVGGRAEFRLDFRPGQPVFMVDAHLQPGELEVEMQNGIDPIRNRMPATVRVLPDRLEFDSTELVISGNAVELCGAVLYPNAERGEPLLLRLYLAGSLDVPRFGALAESMANLDLGFDIGQDPQVQADPGSQCLQGRLSRIGKMRIAGPLDALQPRGQLVLRASRLLPRGYGREIALAAGARLHLATDDAGRLRVEIPDKSPLEGRVDDGRFRVHGSAALSGYQAEEIDLRVSGVDLAYVAPKEYSVVVSPTLRFRGERLGDAARRKMMLSGDVVVTEGAYSRSFDLVGRVIGGVRGRELDTYSAPLLERMPWLGAIGLAVSVRGQNFEVLSRFPIGRADLELGFDMKVRGTFADPELYGRVEVLPGSLLTYDLFRREFEVTEGSIDFNGAIDRAWLSMNARTEIALDDAGTGAATSVTSSVGPNLSSSGTRQLNKVVVTVGLSGPLDDARRLNIQLSSTPSYGPEDIQTLIAFGQLRTGVGSGALGSRTNVGFITDDIAGAVSKALLSTFVDSVTFGIATAGGVNVRVVTSLGKSIQLTGEYYGEFAGISTGSATLSIRLGERLSLDGLLRINQASAAASTGQQVNVNEAKLRFRVPLTETW